MFMSTTKPNPSFLIKRTKITHAVPDAIALADFAEEICAGIAVVELAHNPSPYHNFTDFTRCDQKILAPLLYGIIGDFNNAHVEIRNGPANAGSHAACRF